MMKFLQCVTAGAGLAALLVGGSVMVAGPASAATSNCPSGFTCGWRDSNYVSGTDGGLFRSFDTYNYWFSGNWPDSKTPINDSISSIYNNGQYTSASWFLDRDCKGASITLGRGGSDNDLASSGLNDNFSAGAFASYTTACQNSH